MQKLKFKLQWFRSLVVLTSCMIVMSSCDKELAELDQNKVLRKISVQEQELINATNRLSLDILRSEFTKNDKENMLFSPVSVGMALGMIYNGVGVLEKTKIQDVMTLDVLMEKELNKSYNELLNFFNISYNQLNISYANSMWFSQDIYIKESYRTKVMAYYDAEVTELNYNKTSAMEYINSWGSMKTNGSFAQLTNITPSKSEDIFLINAFSLNTKWKNTNNLFRSTNQFTFENGDKKQIATLNWDGADIRFSDQSDYSYFEIPFENDLILLSVIQSENPEELNSIINDLSVDELKFLRSSSEEFRVNLSLPQIDFNTSKSLKSTLSDIGLRDLFLSTTNLSPSFEDGNRHLSDISQLSKIKTNTRQFAVQESDSFSNMNLQAVTVDKPFIYFVQDKHTSTILFAGFYSNPVDLD